MTIVAVQPALKKLASEDWPFAEAHNVANEYFSHACGQRRSVVSHLVGVREDRVIRLFSPEKLLQSEGLTVSRVLRQQRVLNPHYFSNAFAGNLSGKGLGV
jgi:hypothetical protein